MLNPKFTCTYQVSWQSLQYTVVRSDPYGGLKKAPDGVCHALLDLIKSDWQASDNLIALHSHTFLWESKGNLQQNSYIQTQSMHINEHASLLSLMLLAIRDKA